MTVYPAKHQAVSDTTAQKVDSYIPSRDQIVLGSGIITGILGEGGMAVVYEIWNEALGVKRAVKVLRPGCTQEGWDRFNTEMKVMAQLDHPNIIRIHSVGWWQQLPYIEMEKIDGWSLDKLIKQHGALPAHVSVAVSLLMARALSYTHSLEYVLHGQEIIGLLHRDLKPANILISKKGTIRLTDFGIATPMNVSMHTPDGNVVGSLQYIAPEQLRNQHVDHRADIFSFGCVLYEMLTGFKVFPDREIAKLVPKRLANDFDSLKTYSLKTPKLLVKLISRCLESSPRRRPHSMGIICKDLNKILLTMTNKTPEEVVRDFISHMGEKTNFISIGRKSLVKQYISLVVGTALVVSGTLFVLTNKSTSDYLQKMLLKRPNTFMSDSQTFLDSLKLAHKTQNFLDIMHREDGQKNYNNVLLIYNSLSEKEKNSIPGILLTLRALEKTNQITAEFLEKNSLREGEFLLIKARWLLGNNNFKDALLVAERAKKFGSYYLKKTDLLEQLQIVKAQGLTGLAVSEGKKNQKQEALQLWQEIKKKYPQTDPVYQEAVKSVWKLSDL